MLKKMFVGNLPYTTTDEELRTMFAQFGDVRSAKVIMDRETGRSRGFGFVEMEGDEADAAMQALEGNQMGGRPLRINEAMERNDRPSTGGGGRPDRSGPREYDQGGDRRPRPPRENSRYSRD
jgi:RNA recognition motif-containing protein